MTLHVFMDTSYNYNYKLDTMHMQSMCLWNHASHAVYKAINL